VTDALNHQTTFTYDAMDRLTKITYPDTTTTQFATIIAGGGQPSRIRTAR